MSTIIFWNIAKKDHVGLIASLALEHNVDIILLAEANLDWASLLLRLNDLGEQTFRLHEGNLTKIRLLTRLPRQSIELIEESDHWTIWNVHPPLGMSFILVGVHLVSKLFFKDESQTLAVIPLITAVERAESQKAHQRTVVVGDFNMNPFEPGVVGAGALHAVMDRRVAQRRQRIVQGKSYNFFYNPTWGLLGDLLLGPSGTYYSDRSEHVCYFWNAFDQVLLRPDLLEMFDDSAFGIVERVGGLSLIEGNGLPNTQISDHLPLKFRLAPTF